MKTSRTIKKKIYNRLHFWTAGWALLSLFLPSLVFGQGLRATYPVQATAVLYPPYSLYLSDYANPAREKVALLLLNRDLMESEVEVRLHLSIRAGNGLRLETRDYNPLPVFRLPAGLPVRLGSSELAAYFQLQNLTVNGAFDGKIPEGLLEICFSVYEVHTGALLSQTSCARAWITLNRPPLLSLPLDKAGFPFREPQQFVFQWTPRHQALSNVEYIFTLKEIFDRNTAIENAFMYSPVIFTKTVSMTNLAYTAFDPPLLENATYAWQVQAVVRDGFEELNLFENNGYSEIRSFSLQPACYAPTGLSAVQEGSYEVIRWTPSDRTAVQVVAYRGKQNGGDWHLIRGNMDYANLFDLSFGTEYEYKAGTVCVDGSIVYSEIRSFIFEDQGKDILENCGLQTEISFDRNSLLDKLSAGDVFIAGDFPVTVTKTSGQDGTFSGAGWTQLPVFRDLKVAVKFDNVQINSDRQLIVGFVETTYDASESQMANLDFIDQGGTNTGNTTTGDIWTDLKTKLTVPPGGSLNYDPETGSLVITDADGNPLGNIALPAEIVDRINNGESFTCTVQDGNGDIYTVTVDEDGNASVEQTGSTGKGGSDSGQFDPTTIHSEDALVFFAKGSGQYAFDEWNEAYKDILLIRDKYEHLGSYDVPAKLIPPGRTDKVAFTVNIINRDKIDPEKIIFRSGTGTEYTAKDGEISITGGRENDAQDIYALYPDGNGKFQTLGKLKVLSYKELDVNVKIVPVNSNTMDEKLVESYLNDLYGQLGIRFTVRKDENFSYPDEDLQSESSGFFSRYTNEMKALNAAYKSQRGVDKQTVYLFVLNTGNVKAYDLAGDMPRGGQFGYIFRSGESQANINRTIAHELGHGKFKLRHTFDSDYGAILKQGTTDNLMDYGTGTHLAKWQWDVLFDPALLVSPFEGDEEGLMISSNDKDKISIKIDAANFDFAPGIGKMEISYSLGKQTMDILKKYPNEKKELKIAIADRNGKFVHIESKEPAEKNNYTWNGVNTAGDTITISGEPYNVAFTLILGEEKGWFDSWQAFKDKLYEAIKSDSVQRIITSVDTSFTMNPRRIEWEQYKDMQRCVLGKSYDNYVKLYDLYMQYEGVKEVGNPFEYIKQNTETFTFLGKSIVAHKEFTTILKKVEENLKQKGAYEAMKAKYQNNMDFPLVMRTMNDPKGGGTVSEHGFGLAIDMGVSKNPQIIGSQKPLVRFFIKKATGFDLGAKKTSYMEVKNAHNKFVSLYANTNNEGLKNKYVEIQKYCNNTETIKLDDLQNVDNQLQLLQERYNAVISDSVEYVKIDDIRNEMSLLINKVNNLSSVLDYYINAVIFADISKNALADLKSKIQSLNGSFNLLKSENKNEANFSRVYFQTIDIVIKEIENFLIEVQQINKSYQDLNKFGNDLNSSITTIGFNNVLLRDGFCDIEPEIIEAFLTSDSRIQWGGTFSIKIDAMHFGFTTKAATDIINNKK